METLLFNSSARVRRVVRNGRAFLVAPMTLIVPGVLPGSKGALFYPASECARNASEWDGTPIVVNHPTDTFGRPIPASHPSVEHIGFLRNTTFTGKLRSEGWFDAEATRQADPSIYNRLMANEPVELSTGLYTENEERPGSFNGRTYHSIARNYRPDHLAVLPNQRGACSIADGCGVLVNANPKGINQYTKDDEGGSFKESKGVLIAHTGTREYRIGKTKEGKHVAASFRKRPNGKADPTFGVVKLGVHDDLESAKDAVLKHADSNGHSLTKNEHAVDDKKQGCGDGG